MRMIINGIFIIVPRPRTVKPPPRSPDRHYNGPMPRRSFTEFSELGQYELDPDSIRLLPEPLCRQHAVVVLGVVDRGSSEPVQLGMARPDDRRIARTIARRLAREVEPVALEEWEIDRALSTAYQREGDGGGHHRIDLDAPLAGPGSSAVELVDDLIGHAIAKGASDIHVEVYPDDVDVRVRVDGALRHLRTPVGPNTVDEVVSRIKVLAGLKIVERRAPQDGRFRVEVIDDGRRRVADLRVSVLPGPSGEDAVLRVLDPSIGLRHLDQLGLTDEDVERFRALLANPEGMILVAGTTGSGKTTTLYAALAELVALERKVLTAEDPIEYLVPKVNQKQVTPQLGFADLARAFLRQDPDALLIGEIRDLDTADTAAKAAATGHVVLSTLHTSDALGSVSRLRSLGVEDDQIADALLGLLAQRLVRKICEACREPAEVPPDHAHLLGPLLDGLEPVRGAGCETCSGTGYRGRTGIYELAIVDEEIQERIARGAPGAELRALVRDRGFVSMVDHGFRRAREGITSVDELVRVLPYRHLAEQARRAPF